MKNKKQNKRLWWIIGAVVIITIILIIVFSSGKKKNGNTDGQKSQGTDGNQNELDAVNPAVTKYITNTVIMPDEKKASFYASLPSSGFPVRYGDRSKEVYLLQAAMNKIHGSGLKLDGVYGSLTQSAVQTKYGVNSVDKSLASKILNEYEA